MHRKQILYRNDKTLLWNLQPISMVHPYGEMAKSVGLRLGEPLDVSHGINYSPLTASDH